MAAVLHDIGKVGDPRPRAAQAAPRSTPEEWALMREHPVIGERILRAHPRRDGRTSGRAVVRHEHERFDGKATRTASWAARSRSAAASSWPATPTAR